MDIVLEGREKEREELLKLVQKEVPQDLLSAINNCVQVTQTLGVEVQKVEVSVKDL